MTDILMDKAIDLMEKDDTQKTSDNITATTAQAEKAPKKEPLKHDEDFIGFCVEPHNQALVKDAVSGLWSDAVVNVSGFDDAYEFLKKKIN